MIGIALKTGIEQQTSVLSIYVSIIPTRYPLPRSLACEYLWVLPREKVDKASQTVPNVWIVVAGSGGPSSELRSLSGDDSEHTRTIDFRISQGLDKGQGANDLIR